MENVENNIILESEITCPECGHKKIETMPTDSCQFFYECGNCGTILRPNRATAVCFAYARRYKRKKSQAGLKPDIS